MDKYCFLLFLTYLEPQITRINIKVDQVIVGYIGYAESDLRCYAGNKILSFSKGTATFDVDLNQSMIA